MCMDDSDDRLFHKLCNNNGHNLLYLLPLPNTTTEHYNLCSASSHDKTEITISRRHVAVLVQRSLASEATQNTFLSVEKNNQRQT